MLTDPPIAEGFLFLPVLQVRDNSPDCKTAQENFISTGEDV
jgi:hypothetical protein